MIFIKGTSFFYHKIISGYSYEFSKMSQLWRLRFAQRTLGIFVSFHKRFCHNLNETNKLSKNDQISILKTEKLQNSRMNGPGLEYFISNAALNTSTLSQRQKEKISHPYINPQTLDGGGKKVFFQVYGCQMNVSDADIAWSILKSSGYSLANTLEQADVILIVTCAIREASESKVWRKLFGLRAMKRLKKSSVKIGVLGCMAERIGSKLVEKEKIVDVVAGPDSYKDLPRLLALANEGEKTLNVLLSHDETYATVNPVSLSENKVSAFVSIMRGCNNMCSYCIVPFTRGKERSRDIESILNEINFLSEQGIKEITLLGQNVNSYRDTSNTNHLTGFKSGKSPVPLAKGFKTVYKMKSGGKRFADLLDEVSLVNPEMRIRFTSPHPKDFPDEVLHIIKERSNICKHLHLPAQSGSSRILDLMRRGYTREAYLDLVSHIRSTIPSVYLSSDFICGFCSESDAEYAETVSLLKEVQYNMCYIFPYSTREKTSAHRKLQDDIPQNVKDARALELHQLYRDIVLKLNLAQIGQRHLILIQGESKRSSHDLAGRNDGNTKVIIPNTQIPVRNTDGRRNPLPGDYVEVLITDASSQVLKATPLMISSIQQFYCV